MQTTSLLLSVLLVCFAVQSFGQQMRGVYYWSWSTGKVNVSETNMGVAFSGENDAQSALDESNGIRGKLQGSAYISIGGGDAAGRWTSAIVQKVTQYCSGKKFSGYTGVCFDVEEGDGGLESQFAAAFSACKSAGYVVFVTTSHSAPYGFSDSAALMRAFISNRDIDYLSPQLYSSGNEKNNDYATTNGVQFTEWAKSSAKIVPSIVGASYYADANSVFKSRFGINIDGYVRWSQQD